MSGPPSTHLDSMVPYRLFREYKGIFDMLLGSSKTITLYFIHSRRWREDHIDELRGFLTRRGTSMTVFLPDLENTLLIDAIKSHFDDGPYIPAYIADAYSAYLDLRKHYKRRVKICLFSIYPTYSIYKFDDKIIAAMYPTTLARKSVPSFHFGEASRIGAFVADDLNRMMKESRKPRDSELAELASRYQDSGIRKKRGR